MNFLKQTKSLLTSLIATTALLGAVAANAQTNHFRLPETHTSQHRDLIANQKPISSIKNQKAVEASVIERENAAEIFNTAWNSESVNPYGSSVQIPATKKINVADFHAPVPGKLTSPFGWRARFGRMHKGVDLNLRVGDTVRAAFSGKVRLTKYNAGGYGYYVVVRHDNGMETVYGHLSRFLVKPNQRVKAGEPIALGGNTGRSTGPHLHFETRYMGIALNPESIIDFANKTTHQEYYTFDRNAAERAIAAGSRGTNKAAVANKPKSNTKATVNKSTARNKTKRRR